MDNKARPGADMALAAVLIGVSLLIIYGTLELPAGTFDPLGSATIPQVVAVGIIVFSVWIFVHALAERREMMAQDASLAEEIPDDLPKDQPQDQPVRSRYDLAVALLLMSVVYVLVMAMDWVRFSIATLVFLLLSIGTLSGFDRRVLPLLGVLAVVLGFGLEYVFTQVFVIDLP